MAGEEDYELSELAAIRELDGGCPADVAELLAEQDVEARRAASPEMLIAERARLRKVWLAETDPDRCAELRGRWQALSMQIAELKLKGQ